LGESAKAAIFFYVYIFYCESQKAGVTEPILQHDPIKKIIKIDFMKKIRKHEFSYKINPLKGVSPPSGGVHILKEIISKKTFENLKSPIRLISDKASHKECVAYWVNFIECVLYRVKTSRIMRDKSNRVHVAGFFVEKCVLYRVEGGRFRV